MNIQMTAGEALQAFCRAWFVERDVEAAMAFIREDVDFEGTAIGESARGRDEMLLTESLPGGMMGGYIEENFPFYFVNRRMLNYLGYADEAEFVADIEGCVSNCMHPEDRDMVERAVMEQLE